MSGIYWLASFPKSGNTWTRAFLSHVLQSQEEGGSGELDINTLTTGAIGSSREWVQDALGFEISELSHEEIDRLRPRAYQWIADHSPEGYHKIHDAYTYLPDGQPLIPMAATRGAVYLVRNPLDVALSYAHHSQLELDDAVRQICDPELVFCQSQKAQMPQLRQILLGWGAHVQSWLDADLEKICVRYEDLHRNPLEEFGRIARFLGLEVDSEQVAAAVEACRFERLSAQERERGFVEKLASDRVFFRNGRVGDWQTQLSPAQVAKIIDTHAPVMQRLGYLDAAGEPTGLIQDRLGS